MCARDHGLDPWLRWYDNLLLLSSGRYIVKSPAVFPGGAVSTMGYKSIKRNSILTKNTVCFTKLNFHMMVQAFKLKTISATALYASKFDT